MWPAEEAWAQSVCPEHMPTAARKEGTCFQTNLGQGLTVVWRYGHSEAAGSLPSL